MKLLIVGGVAGGASAAARARRLSEEAEIVLFERGPDVSFANCGLPYYLGGEIAQREKLLIVTPARLRELLQPRRAAQYSGRGHRPAGQDDPRRDLLTGRVYEESYDKLILAPGAAPLVPPMPGVDLPGVFTLRNLQDTDRIRQALDGRAPDDGVRRAVILGAGFIGLELAENLVARGIATAVVERNAQVLPPLDREMTAPVEAQLRAPRHRTYFGPVGRGHRSVRPTDWPCDWPTAAGWRHRWSCWASACGRKTACVEAGLAVGPGGGIRVNEHLQTDDPDVYAVGDAIEVRDFVTGQPGQVPLAGPANRQGRLAADHVFGRRTRYRERKDGHHSRLQVYGGGHRRLGEGDSRQAGRAYRKVYVHPTQHAGYFPGTRGCVSNCCSIRRAAASSGRKRSAATASTNASRAGRGHPSRHDRLRPGGNGAGLRRRNTDRPKTR